MSRHLLFTRIVLLMLSVKSFDCHDMTLAKLIQYMHIQVASCIYLLLIFSIILDYFLQLYSGFLTQFGDNLIVDIVL